MRHFVVNKLQPLMTLSIISSYLLLVTVHCHKGLLFIGCGMHKPSS